MRKFDETADVNSVRTSTDVREPWLVISSAAGVRAIPLPKLPRITIGRMHTSDIVIDDESVSRQHAAIHHHPPNLLIEDLGSRNKTRVAGRALSRGETAALPVGAVVEVGYATMFVQVGRPAAPAPVPQPPARRGNAIVHDPTMQRLYALLDVIAPSPLNVLILGETGTGKEVFAESIHAGSARSTAPFLRVNCAALSGSLLESELFGHEKGAFTGALTAKAGLFEAADGGTVFLDEVGELPLETQAKLLRVIEYGEVIRLGSVQPRRVNVRYVAATNRDLQQFIAEGRFRSDLFFRLNGFSVTLPPLRKRRKEIAPLGVHFLTKAAQGRPFSVTPEAQQALEAYGWPGNIRELKNVLERAIVLAGAGGRIDPIHLQLPDAPHDPGDIGGPLDTMPPAPAPYGQGMQPMTGTWPGAASQNAPQYTASPPTPMFGTPHLGAGMPPHHHGAHGAHPMGGPGAGMPGMAPPGMGSGVPGAPVAMPPGMAPPPGFGQGGANDLRAQRESWEKQQILGALERTSGNQKEAAKLLGISRRTLINKIEAYGIARPRKRT